MKTLNSTSPHFVRCMKPNKEKKGNIFTAEMMLEQLNYAGLLEVCRIRQIGYPVRKEFAEFMKRYICLFPSASDIDSLIAGLKGEGMVTEGDAVKGRSKVFMRQDQALRLEERREDALRAVAIRIQNAARGWLARLRRKRCAEIVAGLKKAVADRDEERLDHFMRQSTELPFRGVHLSIVREAAALQQTLAEERRAKELLKGAIASREIEQLLAAIETCEKLNLHEDESVIAAKGLLTRIREEADVKKKLGDAVAARERSALEVLIARADELELTDCAEYKQASAVLDRIRTEEDAIGQLTATSSGDLRPHGAPEKDVRDGTG